MTMVVVMVVHNLLIPQISRKSTHKLFSCCAHANEQTNKTGGENITSLRRATVAVIIVCGIGTPALDV